MKRPINIPAMVQRIARLEETARNLAVALDDAARKVSVLEGMINATDPNRNAVARGTRPTSQSVSPRICLDAPFFSAVEDASVSDPVTRTGRIQLTWCEDHWEGGGGSLVADGKYEVEGGAVDGEGLASGETLVGNEPVEGHSDKGYLANAIHVAVPEDNDTGFPMVCLTAAVVVRDNSAKTSGMMTFKFFGGKAYPVAILAD